MVRFVSIRYILLCFFFNIECSFGTTCCTSRDNKETTEDIESKSPLGYGDFSANGGSNGSSSDGGSDCELSDNDSDYYASSECDSDSENELKELSIDKSINIDKSSIFINIICSH